MPSGSPALVRWVHVVVKFRSKTMRREILANRRMLCRKFGAQITLLYLYIIPAFANFVNAPTRSTTDPPILVNCQESA